MSDPTSSPAGAGLPCLRCRVDLVMSDRQGIEIDYCPKCRGVWLDRGELDKIIERNAQFYTAPAQDAPPQAAPQQLSPPSATPFLPTGQVPPGYAPVAPPPPGWGQEQGYGQHDGGHGGSHGDEHGGGYGRNGSFLGRLFG